MSLTLKSLPVDIDAESRVLGILVKYPHCIDEVIGKLQTEHFYSPEYRRIYEVILHLYNQSGRISYTQIYSQLRADNSVSQPAELLIGLTESFTALSELEPSIELLQRKAGARRILEAVETIKRIVLEDKMQDLAELQERVQELIFAATASYMEGEDDAKSLLEVLNKCYLKLIERRKGLDGAYGLSVRFPSIDAMTTGFKKKDLIILAARPSMGKTALAMNMAVNVAKRNIPVLLFSLEMDDEQVGDRIVLTELFRYKELDDFEISSAEYQTRLSDQQFARAQTVFNELYELPVTIIDKRGLTSAEIRAKARKVKIEYPNLGLIIIDYLQLIKPTMYGGNRNWTLIIGEIVRELRDLAGELDVPIILISQLNRSVESRDNKRPMLSDLRDSGNIEEFADVVMFLYRDDYYYPDLAVELGTTGEVEVIFAKQRKGPTGTVKLKFIKEYTRFIDEFIE